MSWPSGKITEERYWKIVGIRFAWLRGKGRSPFFQCPPPGGHDMIDQQYFWRNEKRWLTARCFPKGKICGARFSGLRNVARRSGGASPSSRRPVAVLIFHPKTRNSSSIFCMNGKGAKLPERPVFLAATRFEGVFHRLTGHSLFFSHQTKKAMTTKKNPPMTTQWLTCSSSGRVTLPTTPHFSSVSLNSG